MSGPSFVGASTTGSRSSRTSRRKSRAGRKPVVGTARSTCNDTGPSGVVPVTVSPSEDSSPVMVIDVWTSTWPDPTRWRSRDPSAGLFITQLSQRQQSVCRRVPGTDDESVPTSELLPVASQNIRQRRCHEPCVTSSRLSDCGKACLPEWVRGLPGAGCINDGTNLMVDDLAISALHSDEEGRSFTAGGSCTVHTGPAHSDDSR